MATVLVADDDADFRRFLRFTLEGAGYAVEEAPNGEEALRLARARKPSLMLMDFDFGPPPDGSQVVAQLRQRPELSDLPVVFVTATTWAWFGGAKAVLFKPVDPDDLLGVVRGVLEAS